MTHQNKHLHVNMNTCKVDTVYIIRFLHKSIHTLQCTSVKSVFLCADWSFMSLYDDILIKVISHNVGTVIRHKPTPSGVITALVQHTKKRKREQERNE